MAKTRKRQRNHPFPRSPSDSASKTAPSTIWIGSGAIGRYIVVTSAVQDLVQLFLWTAGSGSDDLSVHVDACPSGCFCCRHGPPLLMILAWPIVPTSVAIETTKYVTRSFSSWLPTSPRPRGPAGCCRGCRTSLQVWHPHEAIQVLARGTFQSID